MRTIVGKSSDRGLPIRGSKLKIAVIRFPGSNCDQDAFHALNDDMAIKAEYVWHNDSNLNGFDGVFLPGGFSYGDYLRCGAMAARSSIMTEVTRFAREGRPILGACNGFQILCEAQLLPGALLLNESQKFICRDVELSVVNRTSMWTSGITKNLVIPIAHGEGRYTCSNEAIMELEDQELVAFRYEFNPNGSMNNIAGVVNKQGNVLGMMPHPERASSSKLGNIDGQEILRAFTAVLA